MRFSPYILCLILIGHLGCSNHLVNQQVNHSSQSESALTPQPNIQTSLKPKPSTHPSLGRILDNYLPQTTRSILEHADSFEVISISQGMIMQGVSGLFQGHRVLGKVAVTDPELKAPLVDEMYAGITECIGRASCFLPRHGIRAVAHEQIVELIICVECSSFDGIGPKGKLGGAISRRPKEIFDYVLKTAGVPQEEETMKPTKAAT